MTPWIRFAQSVTPMAFAVAGFSVGLADIPKHPACNIFLQLCQRTNQPQVQVKSCHAQSLTNPARLHVQCLLAQDTFHFNMQEFRCNYQCFGSLSQMLRAKRVYPETSCMFYHIKYTVILCFVWRHVCLFLYNQEQCMFSFFFWTWYSQNDFCSSSFSWVRKSWRLFDQLFVNRKIHSF